jgi:hypothetical protein
VKKRRLRNAMLNKFPLKGRGRSWNQEGMDYYNGMYDKIFQDRRNNGKRFDESYLSDIGGLTSIKTVKDDDALKKQG